MLELEQPTKNETKILQFQKYAIAATRKSCFAVCHAGNMDEIFHNFNLPSRNTVGSKVVKLITI